MQTIQVNLTDINNNIENIENIENNTLINITKHNQNFLILQQFEWSSSVDGESEAGANKLIFSLLPISFVVVGYAYKSRLIGILILRIPFGARIQSSSLITQKNTVSSLEIHLTIQLLSLSKDLSNIFIAKGKVGSVRHLPTIICRDSRRKTQSST